jgi:hypothetical protein
MKSKQPIKNLFKVPPATPAQAPVKDLLSPEEENLVNLIATILVDDTLNQANEESDMLPALQQRRSKSA